MCASASPRPTFTRSSFNACLAGRCSNVLLTPPETQEAARAVIENLLPPKTKEKYLKTYENFVQVKITPLQLTQQIFRQYGIQGLFRGLVPTIMREMPGYFFFFGGYEGTRELLAKPGQSKDDIGFFKTMVAGAVGGLVLWTVIFPSDVIKSRVQISNKRQKFLTVGLEIIRKEGALALYNGLKPTLVRTIPATAALFVVYEYSKKFMHQSFGD